MSHFRRALPWTLLALSLATNGWLAFRPRASVNFSADFVTNLVTLPSPSAHQAPDKGAANPDAPTPAAVATAARVTTFSAYADLLAQSLETTEQHDDLARVLGRWIASDPCSASEWLNHQPDDPRYDLPVSQVAIHLTAKGDYALAREWADSIRTPEVRASAIEEILAEQYRHRQLTPAALADAATRAGLSPDRVQGILNYSRLD